MTAKVDRTKAMKAESPAEFAKILGHEDGGKKVRARLRANGIRVSKGHKFDTKAKQLLWGIFVEGKAAAKDKAAAKPKAARKPKVEAAAETE